MSGATQDVIHQDGTNQGDTARDKRVTQIHDLLLYPAHPDCERIDPAISLVWKAWSRTWHRDLFGRKISIAL